MEETTTGFTRQNSYTLALLTLSFIIGEISHFLISVVNMEVARDLHYGDLSCYPHPNESLRSQSFTYLFDGKFLSRLKQIFFHLVSASMEHFHEKIAPLANK